MLSALLVQLFGREVVDRLVAAGYDDAPSIAGAGAERLAEEGEISIALARRVVAVALEDVDEPDTADEPMALPAEPAAETSAEIPAEISAEAARAPESEGESSMPPESGTHETMPHGEDSAGAAGKHVRRPFRRPHTQLASDPSAATGAESSAGSRSAEAKRKGGEPERRRQPREERPQARQQEKPPIDADPFVDDVGLVAWMGTAGRMGSSPGGSLRVADEILDPGPPIPAPPLPATKGSTPPRPWKRPDQEKAGAAAAPANGNLAPATGNSVAVTGNTVAASGNPVPAKSFRSTQPARNGGANRVVVENSFWSFGRPLGPKGGDRTTTTTTTTATTGKRPAAPGHEGTPGEPGGPPSPRRRIHDGH